jgi:hypothetical protein
MVVFGQSWWIQLTSVTNIVKQHHRPTVQLWLIDLCAYDCICAVTQFNPYPANVENIVSSE